MAVTMLLRAACFLVLAKAVEEPPAACPMQYSGHPEAVVTVPACRSTCQVSDEYLSDPDDPENAQLSVKWQCPEECPILAPCSQKRHLRCIVGSDNMLFYLQVSQMLSWHTTMNETDACAFYDPSSVLSMDLKMCKSCGIAMCERCEMNQEKQETCTECAKSPLGGFRVTADNSCEDIFAHIWLFFLWVLGVWGVIRILWMLSLPWRRTINCYFWQARRSKWRLSPLQNGGHISWWKFYEWHWKDRQGVGLMLFFNFHVFVIIVAASSAYIHWRLHEDFPHLADVHKTNLRCPTSDDPPDLVTNETLYTEEVTYPMMTKSLRTYVVVLALSFIFTIINSFCLRCFRVRHLRTSSDGYVLQVEGIPPHWGVPEIEQWAEGECKELNQELECPEEDLVIGVSLVFHTQKDDQIAFDEVVNSLIDRRDMFMAQDEAEGAYSWKTYGKDEMFFRRNYFVSWLDRTYGFKGRPNMFVRNYLADPIRGVERELSSLSSAGHAFVVFKYRHVAAAFERHISKQHSHRNTPKLSWTLRQLTGRHFDSEKHEQIQRRLNLGRQRSAKKIKASFLKTLTKPLLKSREDEGEIEESTFSDDVTDECLPYTKAVTALPEDICWEHYGFNIETVRAKLDEFPSALFFTVLQALILFIPTAIFLAKSSFLTSGNRTVVWQLQTVALGMMAEFGKFMLRLTVVQKASKYGAVTRERQDQVIYIMMVFCDTVLLGVKFVIAVWLTKEAWIRNMVVDEEFRPSNEYALASVVFRLIWPGGIMIGYVLEPMTSILLPQLVNMQVCRCDPYSAHKSAMALRFSALRSRLVKMYADLIVKTMLVFVMFSMVSDLAWQASMYWAIVLIVRYFYLAFVWARVVTESRMNTSRLWNVAMQLWSLPLALLAAVAAYHCSRYTLGLDLPPLDLDNGPTEWDNKEARAKMLSAVCFAPILGTLLWLRVLLPLARGIASCVSYFCCRRCCSDKSLWRDSKASLACPYSLERRPANFFNTNIPLVLIAQLVCRGDPYGQVACLPKAVRERGRDVLKGVQRKLKKANMKREQDYLVHANNIHMERHPKGLPYFSRPGCELKGEAAPWGSSVSGVRSDENGWLRVGDGQGERYLPFFLQGELVLVQERKLLEREVAALAAFGEEEQRPASGIGFDLTPPTATTIKHFDATPPTVSVTGLDDDVRQELSDEFRLKTAKRLEDVLDKRISQNAAKVLHPYVLGKEYQQLNSPDNGSSINFLQEFAIRAPWNETRGVVERIMGNWDRFFGYIFCFGVVIVVLAVAAFLLISSIKLDKLHN